MSSPKPPIFKIAILVPDGISVRNYLFSSMLQHFEQHQVFLLHQLPQEVVQDIEKIHPGKFLAFEIPTITETRKNDLLRKWVMFARLHRNAHIIGNNSIKKNWLFFSVQKGKKKIFFHILDAFAAMLAGAPVLMDKTERWLFKRMNESSAGKASAALLQQIKPDIIFCTHQRSVVAGYIMTAARQLNMCTATVIFSWDNLPKSRINFLSDYYLVWIRYMKKEMHTYYPYISDKQVIITGTPQFDRYYTKEGLWSREYFCTYFGIDSQRPVICFSGNEPTFPSDHLYLKDLLEELHTNKDELKPIVLVRSSPNDQTGRLQAEAAKFPELAIVATPLWKRIGDRDWESNYPTPQDADVLMNLVYHCACVINFGSTMGIDFAHFNKPALYINYNHPECDWFDLVYGYQQQHFKTLEGLDAVVFVNNRSAFVPYIQAAIATPHAIATDRLLWKESITDNIEGASSQIAQTLIQLAAK